MGKCKHNNCQRQADPKDNKLGFCNECIQLNSKACNHCGKASTKNEYRTNWLRVINWIVMILAGLVIVASLIMAIVTKNVQGIAGWLSALLWFSGFMWMRRVADVYFDIAMSNIEHAKKIVDEVMLEREKFFKETESRGKKNVSC